MGGRAVTGVPIEIHCGAGADLRKLRRSRDAEIRSRRLDSRYGIPQIVVLGERGPD
jgi:hypothetical protein